MVLIDIEAAFDSVWHDGHICKLKKMNFTLETKNNTKFFTPPDVSIYTWNILMKKQADYLQVS